MGIEDAEEDSINDDDNHLAANDGDIEILGVAMAHNPAVVKPNMEIANVETYDEYPAYLEDEALLDEFEFSHSLVDDQIQEQDPEVGVEARGGSRC